MKVSLNDDRKPELRSGKSQAKKHYFKGPNSSAKQQ